MGDTTFLKDNLQGFVPTEQAQGIMKDVARGSSVLRLSKVEPMTSEKKKFSIMTEGAGAYWVGETERIKTSKAEWIFPEMEAKKLAVIIPVTREKINDTTINVFEELKPTIAEAFYKAIDAACLFGISSPFKKNIFEVANTAGNKVVLGTNKSLDLDVSDVMALVEAEGEDTNGFVAHYGLKNSLRKLRDANGNALFIPGVSQNELYSNPIEFSRNGAFDKTKAELIAGNFNYSLVGIREGIQYEILKEATLHTVTMADGKPLSLVDSILPFFTKIVKFVTNLVNAFNSLPQPVKSAIGIIIGSIALLSPVFLVLGKLVKSVGSVIGIFKKLSGAAKIFKMLPALITPHTLIVGAAILAIGTVVYQVVKHWDELVDAAKEFGKAIENIFKKIGDVISTIIDGWKIIIGSFVGWVKDMVKNIVDGLLGGLGKIKDKVVDTGKNIGNGIKNGFKAVLGINSPSKVFAGYGVNIGEGLVNGIDKQEDAIDNKFKGLGNKVKGLGDVKPEFADLNNLALSGAYGGSYGLSNISNSNKELNFNPNINMNINIADTGAKGTEQLTQELKSMSETALKNSMIDLFMQDAIRN